MKKVEEDYIVLEHHWYKVPKELSTTRESCWQALADYLEKYAKWNMVFLREGPQVISELDYDTKEQVHVGFIRFSVSPVKYENTIDIPNISK